MGTVVVADKRESSDPGFVEIPGKSLRGWTIKRKLWSSFGLLILVLTVSGFITFRQVVRIDADLIQIVEIEEPLEQAVLEMEINAGETARAVLGYVQDLAPEHLEVMRDSEADFAIFAARFERLAETAEERRLGREVATLYADFKTLGEEIVALAGERRALLQVLRKDVKEIDEIIDERLQKTIDRTGPEAMKKLEAALDMEINIDEAFAAIEGYVLYPDAALRAEAADAERDFERFEALYRETSLSGEEGRWLDRIHTDFTDAVTAGRRIMAVTDELRLKLGKFEAHLIAMDTLLDDRIQPLIHAETIKAAQDAAASTTAAAFWLAVMGAIAVSIAGASGWWISGGVVKPLRELVRGTEIVGGGHLDHRIDVKTGDEFGHLAAAFNRMTENLQGSAKQLRAAQDDLLRKERLAALGQITATVSHELRNPLGTIRTSIFGVRERTRGLGLERALDRIDRSITRCDEIIADLLEFTRTRELAREATAFDGWLDGVLDEQHIPDGVALRRDLGAGVELDIDPERLRRAVINLIDNACQAVTDGAADGGRERVVAIETRAADGRLELAVADTGPGIPADVLPKVFEPLFSTRSFCVGLGLPTVRQIVEQHGGGIDITSEEGRGTRAVLWLPLGKSEKA